MTTLEQTQRLPTGAASTHGRLGLVVLLAMTVVVMWTNDSAREYLKVPVGSVHLIERDFFLYGLFALFFVNVAISRRIPPLGRFGAHVLTVVGLYYVSIVNALAHDNSVKQIFFHLRQVNYLLVYFPFVYFVKSAGDLHAFLRLVLRCAVVAACVTVLLAVRYATSTFTVKNEFLWVTGGAWGKWFHIRVATAFFFGIVLSCLVAMWVVKCRALSRRTLLVLCGLIGGGLGLTVLRSYWVGLALSLLFLLVVMRQRLRFVAVAALVGVAAAVAAYSFFPQSDLAAFMGERWVSSFDRDSVAVADRLLEHDVGMDLVRQRPWLGSGIGTTMIVTLRSIGRAIETSFCHNSLLSMLIFFGLVGCGVLLTVFVLAVARGVKVCVGLERKGYRYEMAIMAGCLAGLVGLVGTSLTAAAMNYATGFFFVGAVLGVMDRIGQFSGVEGHANE